MYWVTGTRTRDGITATTNVKARTLRQAEADKKLYESCGYTVTIERVAR